MSARNTSARPAGRILLAVARRLAPAATRERVLLPLIADFQHEHAEARSGAKRLLLRCRWGAAFLRASAVDSAALAVDHLRRNVWGSSAGDTAAVRLTVARGVAWALVLTGLLLLDLLRRPYLHLRTAGGAIAVAPLLLLVPSALTFALTAGALFGAASASHRPTSRRSLLDASLLLAIGTFSMAAWMTPRANESYGRAASSVIAASLPPGVALNRGQPGDREMTIGELSARSSALRSEGRSSAPVDTEWHKKPALAFSCVALALMGAALARRLRPPVARGTAALAIFGAFYWMLRAGETAADAGSLSPALAMWGPVAVIAAAALALGAGRKREESTTDDGTERPLTVRGDGREEGTEETWPGQTGRAMTATDSN
ncbi:MAG: LptF/LptG family permease [Vicinamibacteria bacterium]